MRRTIPLSRRGRLQRVQSDLAGDPAAAIELCRASHARLLAAAQRIPDEQIHSPSRLPLWTIAHVLTHLARNADGHVRRLEGARRGDDVPRYPGGPGQLDGDIEEGARRTASDIVTDLDAAQRRLEAAWDFSANAGWPHIEFRGHDRWPTTDSPVRRLREVEMHHVDLGVGYGPSDWPDDYVAWELPALLATVPSRLHRREDVRDLIAWLSGRGPVPATIELDPW